MFSYCCNAKPGIENVLEKDMDRLRIRIDEMKKQMNSISELLEALTNESKKKPPFYLDKYNLDKHVSQSQTQNG